MHDSILKAAGTEVTRWNERGIALGGVYTVIPCPPHELILMQ